MSVTEMYRVDGMTCEHCVRAVSDEIGALPGVVDVTVDLPSGAVTVTSASPVPAHAIAEAVDEAGYTLAPVAMTALEPDVRRPVSPRQDPPRPGASTAVVDLRIGGMTCASCASRVEKKLNRIDGVVATVNFATETARVEHDATIAVADLISTVEATGYQASAINPGAAVSARDGSASARLTVAASLTVPLLLIVMVPAWQFAGWQWWVFALATPVVTWCAWPFHRAALANLRHGATTMDTLISLGAIVSYVWSVTALFTGGHLYFEVGAALVTFQLIGRYAEARAKRRAGSALRALLELGAKDAAVLRAGVEHRVPVGQLQVDDLFVVRPGERLATDGVVTEGASAVDASMMTGESLPVEVAPGTAVVGGTVNVGGRLIVRATRVGADTQLAQLARLVAEAQSGKAPVQRLADRVAGVFVPAVLVAAVATFVGWLLAGGGVNAALTSAVAVLIVACPCALGLATPMALLVGTGRGAALGIVIRGPQILETTRRVDTIVLDKTGTVTTGAMRVSGVTTAGDDDDACAVLRIAGALESAAEHPIARAVAAAAAEAGVALPAVTDFVALPGLGARGMVEGHQVVVGRPRLLRDAWHRRSGRLGGGRHDQRCRCVGRRVSRSRHGHRRRPPHVTGGRRRSPYARAAPGAVDGRQHGHRGGRRGSGRHRRRTSGGSAGRQASRHRRAAARRTCGGDGRRWSERRGRTGRGRSRHRDGIGHRRRHPSQRPDVDAVGSVRGRRRDSPVPRDVAHDQGKPVLGVRLQRRGDPARGGRSRDSDRRRRRDGGVEPVRGRQQPATHPICAPPVLITGRDHVRADTGG